RADRDPAEVQRHRGTRLALDTHQVVDAGARLGQYLLGGHRWDLTDRTDQSGLAGAEAAGHHDLHRLGNHVCRPPGTQSAWRPSSTDWSRYQSVSAASWTGE